VLDPQSFCTKHQEEDLGKELRLEEDLTKRHVVCQCSPEVHIHPRISGFIYRECADDMNLPPLLQSFLRKDLRDYSKIMQGVEVHEDLNEEIHITPLSSSMDTDMDIDLDFSHLETTERKKRLMTWKLLSDKKATSRIAKMSRNKDRTATLEQLEEVSKAVSLSIPKGYKTKKGISCLLVLFHKKEMLARLDSGWKRAKLRRWNGYYLVQMMKVRYRKYTAAVVSLYAKS
jgi:hypothetical protein